MFDIKTAPIETLLKDKANAEDSLQFGKLMWQRGIRKVDDMSLAYAILVDEQVIAMIDAELERRAGEEETSKKQPRCISCNTRMEWNSCETCDGGMLGDKDWLCPCCGGELGIWVCSSCGKWIGASYDDDRL